jgi:hypothetical protein
MFKSSRILVLSLALVAILLSLAGNSSLAQKTGGQTCRQIPINLDSKSTTKEQLAGTIKRQLAECGISTTEKEIQNAAGSSLNLIGKSKDPEKGVIYVKTKKFTICASWGRDKDFCDKH